jgi:hypothetical protein
MFHMLQAYVSNISPISDICYSKCFLLQVFLLAGMENECTRRRSPRACAARQQHGVRRRASSSRHMWVHAAGAYRVLKNLVLIARVHDNDRLQLPCFDDHASLQIGPCVSASRLKIVSIRTCAIGGTGGSSMRIRQGRHGRPNGGYGLCVGALGTPLGQSPGET